VDGILAVFNNVDSGDDAEFNAWYNEQHVNERCGVAGFRAGRRYRALEGPHRYFAWYVTDTTAVLQSPDYIDRLEDPTRWTSAVMPGFRDMVRTVCDRVAVAGEGTGGFATTLALRAAPQDVERRFIEQAFGEVLDMPGIVSTEYWRADLDQSRIDTTESRMRDGSDQFIDALVLVQGMDEVHTRQCSERLPQLASAAGIQPDNLPSLWQLLYSAT